MKAIVSVAVFGLFVSPALADVQVSFIEGAPKDRFVVTNIGACDLANTKITIDLAGSESGLVFDVTGNGPGVEVYQPFELVSGQNFVAARSPISDGDNAVTLDLDNFAMGQSLSFTIDVDDTRSSREITVTGSEISGATVGVTTLNADLSGTFSSNAEALVRIPGCAT